VSGTLYRFFTKLPKVTQYLYFGGTSFINKFERGFVASCDTYSIWSKVNTGTQVFSDHQPQFYKITVATQFFVGQKRVPNLGVKSELSS
jgi:hypothetical protein